MIQNLQIGYLHGVRVKICAKYAVNSSRKNVDGNTCRSYTFHSNTKKKFDFCVSYYYDSKCLWEWKKTNSLAFFSFNFKGFGQQ